MREIGSDRVHLTVAEARGLCEHALQRLGYAAEEARLIADHVIDASLCGYEYSGPGKILGIPDHGRFREPRRPVSIVHQTPLSIQFDGGNNVGMFALHPANEAAIEMAQKSGVGIVGIGNIWNSGRSAYFVEKIARAGLVGIHMTGCNRAVAPPGGRKAAIGTNPFAFAFPLESEPFVFDMGTSAIMATEVRLRMRLEQLLPPGVALDSEGNETRDAKLGKAGALLPFGGYKGFGLGMVGQLFGILAGSGLDLEHDNGVFIMAFRPDLLMPQEEFAKQARELIARIKSIPLQEGVAEIRIPSERAFRERAARLEQGIEIDRRVYDQLSGL